MQRFLLKSKIHRATVTEANLDYEGSVTIDEELMRAANIVEFEQVHVYDVTNGNRIAELIVKVKEPQPAEWPLIRPGQTLFTYFHFAADRELTEAMLASGATCVAYETLRDARADCRC
jgi:alanine dehydrogenase